MATVDAVLNVGGSRSAVPSIPAVVHQYPRQVVSTCRRFMSVHANCGVMATIGELEEQFRELRTSLDAIPDVSEPPKSTLRILGSARSEQTWNTLLAYFLDPNQPHGFGIDLLTSFLGSSRFCFRSPGSTP